MDAFEQAVIELIAIARQRVSTEYDTGLNFRAYHNSNHTTQVVEAAHLLSELALKNKHISMREARLCVLAAAFHDVVHNGDSDPNNEKLSAEFVATLMRSVKAFTRQDIKQVEHMILATKCTQKYPKLIQSPPPHDYTAMLICDADTAMFGKPYDEFKQSYIAYFHEINGMDAGESQLHKFLEVERTLVSNHSFWTSEAKILFPHAEENYRHLVHDTN